MRSRIFDDFEENFRSECRSVMSGVRSKVGVPFGVAAAEDEANEAPK